MKLASKLGESTKENNERNGVAVVLPALFDGATPMSHCTLAFLGRIGESVDFTQDQAMACLYDIRRSWGKLDRVVEVTDHDLFGVDKDIPVMLLEPALLKIMHHITKEILFSENIRVSTFFDYTPHVSYPNGAHVQTVTLQPPVLWWGNERPVRG